MRLPSSTVRDTVVYVIAAAGRAIGFGAAGALLAALVLFVWIVNRAPELEPWHTEELDLEFVEHSPITTFAGYLELEDRLFEQLASSVVSRTPIDERQMTNRFHAHSLSDPERWPRNWNRSFELPRQTPRAGVLLLHGLSDSPYSLRGLAERLHAAGAHVVGLRIPGHGTAPSGLREVRWQDMAAAVRLAARHVRGVVADAPLAIVGYSNGGALAVEYTLAAIEDDALPRFDRLVLISPEIGISPVAALAVWQKRLGRLLGLEKLEWSSVLPEYDPFKYQSFAVNAGEQAHRLTREIARRLDRLAAAGDLARFPPVLTFQSGVDSTVSTPAVIQGLMGRLSPNGHELVLFDLNRMARIEPLFSQDPKPVLGPMLRSETRGYALSVVTNRSPDERAVELRHWPTGSTEMETRSLDLAWPREVFSLSHVALPFAATDPLYGDGRGPPSPGVQLGALALRGEKGVLRVTAGDMLRQRWNPFYTFLETRTLAFLALE
jgi:alpha-beta hydrolase superfamily lysophospholipase